MLGSVQKQKITHSFGANVFKTTITVEMKLGLIITTKMCELWVWQQFLVYEPYSFIVWLAFLGQGLSLAQALIKGTAFVTKSGISDPSSLLWSSLTGGDFITLHFEPSLHWGHGLKDSLGCLTGLNAMNEENMWLSKDSAENRWRKVSLAPQLLGLFHILLLLTDVRV